MLSGRGSWGHPRSCVPSVYNSFRVFTSGASPVCRLQSKNGQQQVPLSTATVSMVHSVPELMVSSEVSPASGGGDVSDRTSPENGKERVWASCRAEDGCRKCRVCGRHSRWWDRRCVSGVPPPCFCLLPQRVLLTGDAPASQPQSRELSRVLWLTWSPGAWPEAVGLGGRPRGRPEAAGGCSLRAGSRRLCVGPERAAPAERTWGQGGDRRARQFGPPVGQSPSIPVPADLAHETTLTSPAFQKSRRQCGSGVS